jgi:hypothetical protein
LVSGGVCAQSIYGASHQCLVAGGQRGASEHYGSANTLGQPSPLGIGNSDLYELIAGVYGESTVVTSSEDLSLMPRTHLYQNYPNPFNPTTTIEYSVASRDRVVIEIYNINGQRIKLLVNEIKEPGRYTATWSGKNESDQPVATGIYFCRLLVDTSSSVRKILIIR